MKHCSYITSSYPFPVRDGYSYCFYYCVYCKDDISCCPFSFKPHHEVIVNEFSYYPANGIQLDLFEI